MSDRANSPRVDILMPVHNGQKYLQHALLSITSQTYENWNLVVVLDDCSDDSEEIIQQNIPSEKLTVIKTKVNNIGAALNIGLEQCKSHYIARLDSDDVMQQDRLEIQVNFLRKFGNISVVGSNVVYIDDGGEEIGISQLPTSIQDLQNKMLIANYISHPTVMFRRNALSDGEIYNPSAKGAEDYELWLRLLSSGKVIVNLSEPLTFYRIHSDQVSRKRTNEDVVELILQSQRQAAKRLNRMLLGCMGRGRIRIANSRYFSRLLIWSKARFLIADQLIKLRNKNC